ncbi:MAG: hypothetical protein ABJ092_04220 [Gillisia sp.]
MNKILFLILLTSSSSLLAQFNPNEESGFIVDTIRLKNDVLVPRLKYSDISNTEIVVKVNKWILEQYGMDDWSDQNGGSWGQAYLTLKGYQIKDDIFILDVYMTSRGSDSDRKYFISLISGNEIKQVDVPFSSLIKAENYFSFIEKYWYKDLKNELINSYKCCEAEDMLNDNWVESQSYVVSGFSFSNEKLLLKEYRWGPYGFCWGACASLLKKEIHLKDILDDFSEFGLQIIEDSIYKKENHYFGESWDESTTIEEIKYVNKLRGEIPLNQFFIGKIGTKYSFKMSLKILSNGYENQICGTYYYDSNSEKFLSLKGVYQNNILSINEYSDGKITGHFKIWKILNDQSIPEWKGNWTSGDGKTQHDIQFTASIP